MGVWNRSTSKSFSAPSSKTLKHTLYIDPASHVYRILHFLPKNPQRTGRCTAPGPTTGDEFGREHSDRKGTKRSVTGLSLGMDKYDGDLKRVVIESERPSQVRGGGRGCRELVTPKDGTDVTEEVEGVSLEAQPELWPPRVMDTRVGTQPAPRVCGGDRVGQKQVCSCLRGK